MVSFGDRLRRARIAADLTQDQLGFAVGMTKQAVAAWENGRSYPGFDKWPRLRAALGISLDDLICGDADAATTARGGLNLMEGRLPDYKSPPAAVGCARDSKEFALLMRYRALEARRQDALLDFLKPGRTGGAGDQDETDSNV